jgi:ABC-type branched-subunit amino acid transport system ATPase component
MSHVLEAAKLLSLSSIPLGMPVAALSNEQQRNLSILRAMLIGTTTTPVVIVLEEPFVRLSAQQQDSLVKVFTLAGFKGKVSWLVV